MLRPGGIFLRGFGRKKITLHPQNGPMNCSKHHKRPVRAMPETSQDHRNQKVASGFPFAAGAASRRNVQVIAEPGAQADVPAPPKLLKAMRQIGLSEVDHEMEAQQLSAAARNIAVAAEVAIDLPGKRVGSDQNNPEIRRTELATKGCVGEKSAVVRDHTFAHQAGKDKHQAVEKTIRIESAVLLNLRKKMSRSLNRSGNQVREEANEETIVQEGLSRFQPAFINVHDIGNFLKGVKRNARWKNHANEGQRNMVNAQRLQHTRKGPCEEIKILEDPENPKIQHEREDKQLFAVRVRAAGRDSLDDQKIHRGTADHECKEAPVPPAVEKVACQKQENVLRAMAQAPIHRYYGDQEEEIDWRVKEHRPKSMFSFQSLAPGRSD